MKIFSKLISIGLILIFSCFMLAGCSAHKYELVGIVQNEGDDVITLISEIADEEIKNYIVDSYGEDCYIQLKQNGKFVMGYSLTQNGLTITYEQVGTYEIKHKENTIVFYIPTGTKEPRAVTQQYLNGKIIYYDGVEFLAFK